LAYIACAFVARLGIPLEVTPFVDFFPKPRVLWDRLEDVERERSFDDDDEEERWAAEADWVTKGFRVGLVGGSEGNRGSDNSPSMKEERSLAACERRRYQEAIVR
jgi:hypothetical protein